MPRQILLPVIILSLAVFHHSGAAQKLTNLKTFNAESLGAGPDGPGGDIYYSVRAYNNGGHDLIHDLTQSQRTVGDQTAFAYFKDTGSRWVYIGTRADEVISRTYFDLVHGSVGTAASYHRPEITPVGDRWYLARVTYPGADVTSVHFGIAENDNSPFFEADPGVDRIFFSEPRLQASQGFSQEEKALWVWTPEPVTDPNQRAILMDFVLSKGLNTVYIDAEIPVADNQYSLAEFVRSFHNRGVSVEFVFGDPIWALSEHHHRMLELIDHTVSFVTRYPDAEPDGIHVDIEAHLVQQWGGGPSLVANQYLDLIGAVKDRVSRFALPVSSDIPIWWDEISVSRDGLQRPFHQWVIDIADGVALMDYRDREARITEDARAELNYASNVSKPVVIGVETQCIEPTSITFCEEGSNFMESVLRELDSKMRAQYSAHRGFAVHHYHSYRQLQP